MKGYFKYSTHDAPESQNYWYVLGQKGEPEKFGDAVSPWNKEAALLRIFVPFPLNCVIVFQATVNGNYLFILKDPQSEESVMTYREYSWDEIVGHATLFKGQSFKAAQRILKSKKV